MHERPRDGDFATPSYPCPDDAPYRSPYGATPPPPPRRNKRSFWRWGCVSIFGFIAVIVVGAAISSQHDPGTSVTVTTGGPASNAALPAASEPPLGTPVLDLSGNGTQNTASFNTGPGWSIEYTFDCSGQGGEGNFQIYVYTGGTLSDMPVNALSASGNATTYEHDNAGSHYLTINSECHWTVKVVNQLNQ